MTTNRNSFNKRQREIQKKQKADEKRARRAQIKLEKKAGTYVEPDSSAEAEDLSELPLLEDDEDEEDAAP